MNIPLETSLNYVFCLMIFVFLSFGDARGWKRGSKLKSGPGPKHEPKAGPKAGPKQGPVSTCRDIKTKECKGWKSRGFCDTASAYFNFMKTNCERTCKLCTEKVAEPCKDNGAGCPAWKRRGYCIKSETNKYYGYMELTCKATCGFCKLELEGYTISDTKKTWHDARTDCIKSNGYLVTINDVYENNKLKTVLQSSGSTDSFWIGLSDIATEGNFIWCEGDSHFRDWKAGQPDNGGNLEDCANLRAQYQFAWNDQRCKIKNRYICEKRIDVCATSNHGCEDKCINTGGSFKCACNAGYQLSSNRKSCEDIDECATPKHGCKYNCINLPGSFKCCDIGYQLSGDGTSCIDIDECEVGFLNNCKQNCINTVGSFKCACKNGYQFKHSSYGQSCVDIDECKISMQGCQQKCINTAGSFKCACKDGYQLSSYGKSCSDINECQSNSHHCDRAHGICINKAGGYTCKCKPGYVLQADKNTCKKEQDINECNLNINSCDKANGICVNKVGGYTCKCKPGYVLQTDKKTCKKVQVTVNLKICKDKDAKHPNCAGWKRAKYCEPGHKHFGFMKDNCPLTCGFCECKDNKKSCLQFRNLNYCEEGTRYYPYMKGNCKKTCGFCGNVRKPKPTPKPTPKPPVVVPPAVVFPPANKLNSKLCGIKGPGKGRIVGGIETAVGEFPWIVGIIRKTNQQLVICGGTLLTNRWILTAAHCFASRSSRIPENFRIRLGEHDLLKKEDHERVVEIDTIKVHENWDSSTYNNDIALLRLKNSTEFDRFKKPICMPFQGETFTTGKTCIVAGWGRLGETLTTAKQLQKVELPLTDHKLCKDTFAVQEELVTDQMICSGFNTGGKDSCEGDSGGPLFCKIEGQERFVQTGVVSWGVGCARQGNFGVYARLSSFRNWIEKNVKD